MTTPNNTDGLRKYLFDRANVFERMVPGATSDDRKNLAQKLLTSAILAAKKTDALLRCDPESIFLAVMDAAQLGLTVHWGPRGEAALIPYGQKCQLIIGYRGYTKLMLRSGDIRQVYADRVAEKDTWRFSTSHFGVRFKHIPFEDEEARGETVLYYAVAYFKDGQGCQLARLPKAKADRIGAGVLAKISDKGKREQSPWAAWPEEMGIKSAVRQLIKLVPSEGIEAAMEVEERHEKEVQGERLDFGSVTALRLSEAPARQAVPAPAAASTETPGASDSNQPDPGEVILGEIEMAGSMVGLDVLAKKAAGLPKSNQYRDAIAQALVVKRAEVGQ